MSGLLLPQRERSRFGQNAATRFHLCERALHRRAGHRRRPGVEIDAPVDAPIKREGERRARCGPGDYAGFVIPESFHTELPDTLVALWVSVQVRVMLPPSLATSGPDHVPVSAAIDPTVRMTSFDETPSPALPTPRTRT